MTEFPWELAVLAGVLALNRMLVPAVVFKPLIFWTIQAVDAGFGLAIALIGLPGLDRYDVVNWLVAGLFAFHVVQNISLRDRALYKREKEQRPKEPGE